MSDNVLPYLFYQQDQINLRIYQYLYIADVSVNWKKMSHYNRKTDDLWKTIDDVHKTFDSISIINRGKPTTKPHFSLENPWLNHVQTNASDVNKKNSGLSLDGETSCDNYRNGHEDYKQNGFAVGRGAFFKELNKIREPMEKDLSLQAEIREILPISYSNEVIEKYWTSRGQKVEEGQFDDINVDINSGDINTNGVSNDLAEIEQSIHFSPIEHLELYQQEIEARVCSPPLINATAETPSSPLPLFHHNLDKVESITSDDETAENLNMDIKTLSSPVKTVTPTKFPQELASSTQTKYREKKCRNALINGLIKKDLLVKQKEPAVLLKTPSDFLATFSSNNNMINVDRSKDNCNSYSCIAKTISKSQIRNNFECSDDSYKYCPDDFPAL